MRSIIPFTIGCLSALLLFNTPIQAQKSRKRWFPAEAARCVWMPYLYPAFSMPRNGIRQVGDPGFHFGVHALRYSPLLRLAPALRTDLSEQSFTLRDSSLTRYIAREFTVVPHFNWKFRRADFQRDLHLALNFGLGASFAFHREQQQYLDGGTHRTLAENEIRAFRFYGYLGLHLDQDVFHTARSSIDKSPRVGVHFLDIGLLIPWYELGNFYRSRSHLPFYQGFVPTLSIGQALDLRRNTGNYEAEVDRSSLIKWPTHFDQSRRKLYTGLHFEVLMQQPFSDSLQLDDTVVVATSLRLAYAHQVGWSLHWGNYGSHETFARNRLRFGLFASAVVTFRRYVRDDAALRMYDFKTAEIWAGGRIGLGDLFGQVGGRLYLPFDAAQMLPGGSQSPAVFPEKKLRYGWFAGVSYRHWLYVRLKPSFFMPYFIVRSPTKNRFWARHEISVGTGF